MIIFNTDLDNTIIYSYKHDIGEKKSNVEIYKGREISFITDRTYDLLLKVRKKVLVVPTTTRTVEQYRRIDLGTGDFEYVLSCNGGILLINGVPDKAWYKKSLEIIKESNDEIQHAIRILSGDNRRTFELRYIDRLFVFTKCNFPEKVVKDLRNLLDLSLVEVFNNGEKVYVLPRKLNKGNAVTRLSQKLKASYVISAGDSEFDVSMVSVTDVGIVPLGFKKEYNVPENVIEASSEKIFSEWILEKCLEISEGILDK